MTIRKDTPLWFTRALGLAFWLALGALSACGGSDDRAGADAASASIGAAGGTVAMQGGAQVVIPPAALAAATTIRVERSAAGAPALPQGFAAGSAMFAMTPHGTLFAAPVTVHIPVDLAAFPAGLTPTLYKTNAAGEWERVPGATLSGSTFTAQVTSFSFFNAGAAPPQITQAPQDATVNAGSSATFSVTALGSPPFSYQWQRSSDAGATFANVPGATDRSHTTPATVNADDGSRWRAIVSNPDGPATSPSATLTVTAAVIAPAIVTQPASASVAVGASATFTVVANGTAPLHQWQISRDGGANFSDVPGANNASYTHAAAAIGDNGAIYRVLVSNGAGSVTSANAMLNVTAAPPVGAGASGARLAAGADFSVALLADGTLRSWGSDIGGTLGNGGADADRATPGPVVNLSDVVAVDSSGGITLALRRNGEVWGWGYNGLGMLGNGTLDSAAAPTRFIGTPALGAARAIAAGNTHSLVLRSDGRIEASGHNVYGQIGNTSVGYLTSSAVEVTVTAGMRPIVAISAGNGFSVALDEDGVVWTWGNNASGQLGHGTLVNTAVPQRVAGIDPVRLISAGSDHVLAVARDGQIWSWGSNQNGKLGQGDVGEFLALPGRVLLTGQIVGIAAGAEHSVSLHFDGTVFTWGINETGQLGNGSASPGFRHTPGFVSLLPSGVQAIAAGGGLGHSLALGPDGRVWAWGYNHRGQLGDGTTAFRLPPAVVTGLNLN